MTQRLLTLNALNIVLTPAEDADYVSLFQKAFDARRSFKIHGQRAGIIQSYVVSETPAGKPKAIWGAVATFFDLDTTEPWLNLEEARAAEAGELRQIVIPERLKPSLRRFEFVFDVAHHALVFEGRNRFGALPPVPLAKFFSAQFAPGAESHPGGSRTVSVHVFPDSEGIERLLSLPNIRTVEMRVGRPNADEDVELEKRLNERMKRMNVLREDVTLTAEPNKTIQLDDGARALARVASRNGYVKVGAKEGRYSRQYSTVDRPASLSEPVDDSIETEDGAFERMAMRFFQRLFPPKRKVTPVRDDAP